MTQAFATVAAVDGPRFEPRQIALIASRARCVIGLACIFVPGLVARVLVGQNDRATRLLTRIAGIRDLVLGIGALTAIKEHEHDAEWLSMGAACDGFDAVVCTLSPGVPLRGRLIGLAAGGSGAYLMKLSRDFAAERDAAAISSPV